MPNTDGRARRWNLSLSAGTTTRIRFTSPTALTSLAVYVGGTVTDVDDLTEADAYDGTPSVGDTVWDVDVVAGTGGPTPLRLVVDGGVETVGTLTRSTRGSESTDVDLTIVTEAIEVALTILGVIVSEGGGGGGGAPTDATYLVATANAGLSDEVVVGATPGGELGGTWATPTVDATHSGSSHAAVQAAAEATAAADATTKANAAQAAAIAASQPLDADLTALAAANNSAVLAATTASFLTADETKLDGIEALADVTDATNVNAAGAVMESDYDANTVLAATSDNTPVPLTLGASTILARLAAGGIVAATPAQLRTLLNVEDGATADQSAAEILAALLTVDGSGSGLDADTLDGIDSGSFVRDTGDETIAGVKTFSSDPLIPDEVYGVGWNGVLEPPTKNAVYDKTELVVAEIATAVGDHDADVDAHSALFDAATPPEVAFPRQVSAVLIEEDWFTTGVTAGVGQNNWLASVVGAGFISFAQTTDCHGLVAVAVTDLNNVCAINLGLNTLEEAPVFRLLQRGTIFALNDGSHTISVFTGLHDDATGAEPTDGFYWRYSAASANWFCVTANAGTRTATDSGVAPAANTYQNREIICDGAGNVRFYIDAVLVATHTTNLPTGTNRYGPATSVIKTLGSGTTRSYREDFYVLAFDAARGSLAA